MRGAGDTVLRGEIELKKGQSGGIYFFAKGSRIIFFIESSDAAAWWEAYTGKLVVRRNWWVRVTPRPHVGTKGLSDMM